MKPLVICLMGPTASGKTDFAVELVAQYPLDIISVDSALVYREMNIGSAKPDATTLARAPHRLIDIRDPAEPYSAAEFRSDALRHIAEITAAGRIPMLVGGTMMYFQALLKGLSPLPPADPGIRKALLLIAQQDGWQALHAQLQEVDPEAAARIHHNDPQRLQRALEVYKITGKPLSVLQRQTADALEKHYQVEVWSLFPHDRAVLHRRIAQRFQLMLDQGFQQEVVALRRRGDLSTQLPAIKSVGYRQMWQYLDGEFGFDEMVEKGIAATRQLAKRQLTWLRRQDSALCLDPLRRNEANAMMCMQKRLAMLL